MKINFLKYIRFKINHNEIEKELVNIDNFNILSIIKFLKRTYISVKFAIFLSGDCILAINPDMKIQNIRFNLRSK